MRPVTVMTIFGTRPEAIKMAPLALELSRRPGLNALCCVTAQHREMLDSVLNIFRLKPDYDLNIMEPRQTLSTITSKCLTGMDGVLEQAKPDLVLVHGDTSTTFAGALAAFYHKVPVGHVEAGLRTYDKWSPYPEEMNRKMVGAIADLHFCPTVANRENLARENITQGVFLTGNTVIDALQTTVRHDLAGPEEAYYWYEGSSAWNALPADERSHDLAQHIPTYETVLDLDPDSITETGYELRGPYPCVYVAFQGEDSASVERYWISTDNGLLVSAEREINGELVYRMTAYGQVQIPCPATASFALPDGQVLHMV